MNQFLRSPLKTRLNTGHKSHQKSSHTLRYQDNEKQGNLFESFLYQDHVTRFRYQFSKLKKCQTLPNLSNESQQLEYYTNELRLLQNIKQNRHKELALNYKQKKHHYTRKTNMTQINKEDVGKIKKQIRGQVMSLNQEFLRQYLYHQKPFNKILIQINEQSNAGIINQIKIDELKDKLAKYISLTKNQTGCKQMYFGNPKKKKLSNQKQLKQVAENKINHKFDKIWQSIQKQIGAKVKMQGQFNLYRGKKYRIK